MRTNLFASPASRAREKRRRPKSASRCNRNGDVSAQLTPWRPPISPVPCRLRQQRRSGRRVWRGRAKDFGSLAHPRGTRNDLSCRRRVVLRSRGTRAGLRERENTPKQQLVALWCVRASIHSGEHAIDITSAPGKYMVIELDRTTGRIVGATNVRCAVPGSWCFIARFPQAIALRAFRSTICWRKVASSARWVGALSPAP